MHLSSKEPETPGIITGGIVAVVCSLTTPADIHVAVGVEVSTAAADNWNNAMIVTAH
jgi:hypothetical protein